MLFMQIYYIFFLRKPFKQTISVSLFIIMTDRSHDNRAAMLGLFTDRNFGDPLICRTVGNLFSQQFGYQIEWTRCDLRHAFIFLPRNAGNRMLKYRSEICEVLAQKLLPSYFYNQRIKRLAQAYGQMLDGCRFGVIAGGGIIHYRHHNYWQNISAFILACSKRNIPVAINAVGIEDHDANDRKCRILTNYLHYSNVRSVTTRDDISSLSFYMNGSGAVTDKIIDPVIFCAEQEGICRNSKSDIIGIGLIKKTIFSDYRVDCSHRRLVEFYSGVIRQLESEGIQYRLFTNGLDEDTNLLQEIEEALGGRRLTVSEPKTASELISIIAGFKGIITARMHSCIIAYSLGIPAVALVWNAKLKYWGMNINKPECYLPLEELDPSTAIAILKEQMELPEAYDEELRKQMKDTHLASVDAAISALDL